MILKSVTDSTDEVNLIRFRGIKSGLVAFLGFLSLKPRLAIETTQQKTKNNA